MAMAKEIIFCPIPSQDMKVEYFSISEHQAKASIKRANNGLLWKIHINTEKWILDPQLITRILKYNTEQRYPYPSGVGGYLYTCIYRSPFSGVTFIAGSNG